MADPKYVKDSDFKNTNFSRMTKMRPDESIFPNNGPREQDIVQNYSGSCYMLSVLRSMAVKNPEQIRKLFTDHNDGTVTVHLHKTNDDGTKEPLDIKVDKSLSPMDAGSAPWVRLLEKAYAASGLMKKEELPGVRGYEPENIPDSEHPFMESLAWYDTGLFYDALVPETVERESIADTLTALDNVKDAEEVFTDYLKNVEAHNGSLTLSTNLHQMQYKKLETRNNVPGIVFRDQFGGTRDNWIPVSDLFRADSRYDGIHAFYKDDDGKPVYMNTSPRTIGETIRRKNAVLSERAYRDKIYGFYQKTLQDAADNSLVPDRNALSNALAYPTGKMNDQLKKHYDRTLTAGKLNDLLTADTAEAKAYRKKMLDELAVFSKKASEAENAPDAAKHLQAIMNVLPSPQAEQPQSRPQQSAQNRAPAQQQTAAQTDTKTAEKKAESPAEEKKEESIVLYQDTLRNAPENFEEVQNSGEAEVDLGGSAALMPSQQIYSAFESAFRKEMKSRGHEFEDLIHRPETCYFAMYQNALKNAAKKDGIPAKLDLKTVDHLLSLAQKASIVFGACTNNQAEGARMTSADKLFDKINTVVKSDMNILRTIRKGLSADRSETMQQQIINAKSTLLKGKPDEAKMKKVSEEYTQRRLPVEKREAFEKQKEDLAKQEATTWRRMNVLASALDKMPDEDSREFNAFKDAVHAFTSDRPSTYEGFIRSVQKIGKLAEKYRETIPETDHSRKSRAADAALRTAGSNEKNMKKILTDMSANVSKEVRDDLLTKESFKAGEHYTKQRAQQERDQLSKDLRKDGYTPEKFAKYHVLNGLLADGADQEISRMTDAELRIRSAEMMNSVSMQFMTGSMPSVPMKAEQMESCYQASRRHAEEVKSYSDLIPEALELRVTELNGKNKEAGSGNKAFDAAAKQTKLDLLEKAISEKKELRVDRMNRFFAYNKAESVSSQTVNQKSTQYSERFESAMSVISNADDNMRVLVANLARNEEDLALTLPFLADGSVRQLFNAEDHLIPTAEECKTWAREQKMEAFREASASYASMQETAKGVNGTYAGAYMKESVKAMKKLAVSYAAPDIPLIEAQMKEASSLMTTVLKGTHHADCARKGMNEAGAEVSWKSVHASKSVSAVMSRTDSTSIRSFLSEGGAQNILDNAQREPAVKKAHQAQQAQQNDAPRQMN